MDDDLIASWSRSKRAEGRSPATIEAYENDTRKLAEHLAQRGRDLSSAQRGDLEACLADGRDAGLARARPKKRIGRPKPANPERATFENRRDTALVMMMATTGVRAGEIMGLSLANVDLNAATFTVLGKGGRARVVALMPKPAEALDRYLRARRRHTFGHLPDLWIGERGRLTDSGLRQMLDRRCDDAGLEHINPHRFRHTFAHEAKSRGMSDGDLMAIAGWQSPQMLHRYGASAAADRARDAHRRLFGAD